MIIGHGGNKKDLAVRLGCDMDQIMDMSSNLNPLGPPETIQKFICDHVEKIQSLPLPDAAGMRDGFARFHHMDSSRVIAGNGTTWFIYTIPRALDAKRVLIVGPTYSDYKDACSMHDIPYDHLVSTPQDRFMPDMDQISACAKACDLVFICNPNNPTGALILKEPLEYLIKKHENTVFVIDESYLPFVDNADQISLVGDTAYKNVIVLSSMSKIFTIPGLRTGFLSAHASITQKIMACYQPWSVNALAQAVIEHIFDHPEKIEPFYQKTRAFIKAEKAYFYDSLKTVKGLELFDSSAYFILAHLTGNQNSKTLCGKIGQYKILIRDCANFEGLSDRYIRFSLKNRDENQQLSQYIKQELKGSL